MAITIMAVTWLFLLLIGLPVGFSLIFATLVFFIANGEYFVINYTGVMLIEGLNTFSLLAVPFFTLTGKLMNSSGITDRIFSFAKNMMGHFTGGMGHVNIFASLLPESVSSGDKKITKPQPCQ